MASPAEIFRYGSYVAHAVCAVGIGLLAMQYPNPTIAMVIIGSLIGVGSVSTVEHRIVPLFVAFGLMMTPPFLIVVSCVNMQKYLGIVVAVLVVVGIAWVLTQPSVTSAAFYGVTAVMMFCILGSMYVHRFEIDEATVDEIIRDVWVNSVYIGLAMLEVFFGVGIAMTENKKRKPRKKKARQIAIPLPDET